MNTQKTAPLFESAPCGRCGGSGSYSFNLMHGSRCYGCNGTGFALTKRGHMAQKMFTDALSVPVETLAPGDLARFAGDGKFSRVQSVTIGPDKAIGGGYNPAAPDAEAVLIVLDAFSFKTRPGHMVRKGWSAEEKAPILAAALAYQASLTKAGKPRK